MLHSWVRSPGQLLATLRFWLPAGGTLTPESWYQRHRVIVVLLWLHALGLGLLGVLLGYGVPHSFGEGLLVAALAVPAGATNLRPRLRSACATLGLLIASALLVHLTNGLTEAHFHFFVMLAVVALYQDWVPFLLGVGFVVFEHGTMGVWFPHQVYDHVEAWDDPWRWALIHGVFVLGLCAAMVAQWRFAERTQAERKRAAFTLARLAAIVTSSDDAIISTDLDGRIISWNTGAEHLFGYTRTEMLDALPHETLITSEWQEFFRHAVRQIRDGDAPPSIEITCRRKDASLVEVGLSLSLLRDENGAVIGWSCIARDITARKRAEAELAHRAQYDALTDLPNRAQLRDEVERALAASVHNTGTVALLVLDLDRFKDVNDTLGHQHGDLLLKEVGERLRAALAADGIVARFGGDEFGVLLPNTDAERVHVQVASITNALNEPFVLQGYRVEVDVSTGIALAPEHGTDFDTLFRHADVAMYVAKREAKGSAVYSADRDFHSPERLRMVGELRAAIDADALVLHYQPKFDLPDARLVGVEALVRWPHPELGMIPPDRFIPLAEQTGLIQPLTHWILHTALRQCRAWWDAGMRVPVAVNLSTRNLHEVDLVQNVVQLLERYQLPPTMLELEITESSLMANRERALAVLTHLQEIGINISVDDFGTGYSSLAYLKDLPVSELKIDRSFVKDMVEQTRNRAIVQSTIDLAHHLGLRVVAEGVEDQSTWELLGHVGCDTAQGYFLSRPVAAERLLEFKSHLETPSFELDQAA